MSGTDPMLVRIVAGIRLASRHRSVRFANPVRPPRERQSSLSCLLVDQADYRYHARTHPYRDGVQTKDGRIPVAVRPSVTAGVASAHGGSARAPKIADNAAAAAAVDGDCWAWGTAESAAACLHSGRFWAVDHLGHVTFLEPLLRHS